MFEAGAADMLFNDRVEGSTFLADVVVTAWAGDLRIEEERELIETAQTISLVKLAIFRQQLGSFHVILDLLLYSPAIYTQN